MLKIFQVWVENSENTLSISTLKEAQFFAHFSEYLNECMWLNIKEIITLFKKNLCFQEVKFNKAKLKIWTV